MTKSIKKSHSTKSSSSSVKKTKLKSRRVHSNALVKHFDDNLTIPAYKIFHTPANAELVMNLEEDQSVYANGGLMVWMNGTIKVKTEIGGLLAGLKRKFLGDGSLFLTTYTGTSNDGKSNKICFSSELPGDIIEIKIKPGEKKLIASGSIVVCTTNIKFDTRFRISGAFTAGSAFLCQLSVDENSSNYGIAWIASFGSIDRLQIKDGEKYVVDNQHFLECDSTVKYNISTLGGIKSGLLSGEGFVMNFQGPCEVLVQNKNFKNLAYKVLNFMKNKK
jgi:uncharacterized protein (TIGR00266 family)